MNTILETPRLYIRELMMIDAPAMFDMDSDAAVHLFVGKKPQATIAETIAVIEYVRQQYIDNGIGRWAVIEKTTNQFIGWTGFKLMKETVNGHINFYDFGYRFTRSKWRQGFAMESAKAALDYGVQTLGFQDVFAMTDIDNIASRSLLEKLGFAFIETFPFDGTPGWRDEGELATWYKY